MKRMVLFVVIFVCTTQQGLVGDLTGLSRKDETAPWIGQTGGGKQWLKRHFAHNAEFKRMRQADLVFVGDSITDFWTHAGRPVWQKEFRGLTVANAGISADRTQQMIWRIAKGNVRDLNPKGYIVMAGTNNLAMDDPDPPVDVTKAIEGIIRILQSDNPTVPVLIVSILPNSADPNLAKRIRETNALLKENIEKMPGTEFLDLWPAFANEADRLKPELTMDGTHLTEKGYQLWANKMRPIWKKWLNP